MILRAERGGDAATIAAVITAAFDGAPHSAGTEASIVAALRAAGALTVSLVAEAEGTTVGHVAFSPVLVDGADLFWYGLAPVSVLPARQRGGIGRSLILAGLERLRDLDAAGCVVLGDPAYYGRFGFAADPALVYPGVPPAYFQRLVLRGAAPAGAVTYHPAFAAA